MVEAKRAAEERSDAGPLAGVRVLELGQLLAGPWAATLLAYFGAEVIKVEARGGDPIRSWRALDPSGTSYWFRSIGRNKHCMTLDLRTEEGRAIAKRLALQSDVLIENFRPGTMEGWGLGPEVFERERPGLVYARVSGFGQTGPYRRRPGYASVAEAMGGLRHLTGMPSEPTVRPNLSLGDTLAGLHTAIGVLVALYERDANGSGRGQTIDTALYEAVFACLESVVPEHAATGAVRNASGVTLTGVAPSNLYPCRGKAGGTAHVIIAANGESMFVRLMAAIGRDDLAADPRLSSNPGRVAHAERVDAAISEWTRERTVGEVVDEMVAAEVPCGPVYDVAAMREDPHFHARAMFERVGEVELPAIVPKLSRTPGRTSHAGRDLGADTQAILTRLLGLDSAEVDALRARGVV